VERKAARPPGLARSLGYRISSHLGYFERWGSVHLFNRKTVLSTCFKAESAVLGTETAFEPGVTRLAALSAASAVGAPGSTVLSAMIEACIEC
jgi:hypothetical protein